MMINQIDIWGYADESAVKQAKADLCELLDNHTNMDKYGFSINLEICIEKWDACFQSLGREEAYRLMADTLCERYKEEYKEEFLFKNECVEYEIEYHADTYMSLKGKKGYPKRLAAFARISNRISEMLEEHTKTIDIKTTDASNPVQNCLFGYRRGIRDQYKNTPRDPYNRKYNLKRINQYFV